MDPNQPERVRTYGHSPYMKKVHCSCGNTLQLIDFGDGTKRALCTNSHGNLRLRKEWHLGADGGLYWHYLHDTENRKSRRIFRRKRREQPDS